MSAVTALIKKEILLEFRQKHALAGVLVYVLATVFVCYLSFQKIEETQIWGALLWITGVFTAFNAMQKTFYSEKPGTQFYMYTLANPAHVILSKLIYNALTVAMLNVISLFFFILFFGTKVLDQADVLQMLTGILLGSTGLGFSLTFAGSLAFKSGSGTGLVAILGFPLIIPLLITMVRHTSSSLTGVSWELNGLNLVVLFVLNLLPLVLGYILFPYIWRE